MEPAAPARRFQAQFLDGWSLAEQPVWVEVLDDVALRILTLPLYPHMDDEHVELVADTLIESVRAGRRVASDAAV